MMVDCGNIRCVQERRAFKKDLLSWTKKIPLVVGLERVAEELLGKTEVDQLLLPFNNLEPDYVEDFEPESKCQFCLSRAKFVWDTVENTTSTEDGNHDNSKALDDPGMKYLKELLPITCAPLFFPSLDQEQDGQPIDLSKTSPLINRSKSPARSQTEETSPPPSKPHIELKVPQIKINANKKKDGGRRQYTEEELTAAVDDIRSGKLGTRRAASIYGIPRSTLRNKIFKLEQNGGSLHHVPQKVLENMSDSIQDENGLTEAEEEWHRKLEQLRHKHNLMRRIPQTDHADKLNNPYFNELKLPFLPNLVRKMTEERVLSATGNPELVSALESSADATNVELRIPSYRPIFTNGSAEEIVANSEVGSNSKIGDTLKDIIAKTISEKIRSRVQSQDPFQVQYPSPSPIEPSLMNTHHFQHSKPAVEEPPVSKRPKYHNTTSASSSTLSRTSSGTNQPKKTRPKRGQYRKYNSQLLMEAVRAVQRGEMSVHRAGSYFGVPHSTLEYKVKERHLLRQKKIAEQKRQQAEASNGKSDEDVSRSQSGSTPSSPPQNIPVSPPMAHSGLLMNGGGATINHPSPALKFGFSVNASATELLRKLQQKVQAKSTLSPESSNI